MELVTSNNQGELSPLEIGIHALKAVPTGKRGRGNKGDGLKAYAERVGKTPGYITQVRQAGEVIESLRETKLFTQVNNFLDRAKHLSAIHKLPRDCWQAACEWLAANEASVADVEAKVKAAAEKLRRYLRGFGSLQECRERNG